MDFITKLLLSKEPGTKEVYDLILVIVDRLTKFVYFITAKESWTAEELAYLVLRTLLSNYQIPKEFITN